MFFSLLQRWRWFIPLHTHLYSRSTMIDSSSSSTVVVLVLVLVLVVAVVVAAAAALLWSLSISISISISVSLFILLFVDPVRRRYGTDGSNWCYLSWGMRHEESSNLTMNGMFWGIYIYFVLSFIMLHQCNATQTIIFHWIELNLFYRNATSQVKLLIKT